MRNIGRVAWIIIITLVSSSDSHSLNATDEVCPSRFEYSWEMLKKLIEVEKDVRESVHSLTEHIHQCIYDGDTGNIGRTDAIQHPFVMITSVRDKVCFFSCRSIPPYELLRLIRNVCPENWYRQDKSCYFFSDEVTTWPDAMEKCTEYGAYLAVIKSRTENTYLQGIASSTKSIADTFFIGGTDIFKEGEWRWAPGMKRLSADDFSDWNSGQPDNGGGKEHCLVLKGIYHFRWNDDPCRSSFKFICEKDLKI